MRRLTRRELLGGVSAVGLGIGSAKAIDNVVLGYGGVGGGTNLHKQDLAPLLTENRSLNGELTTDEARYWIDDEQLWIDPTMDERWQQYPLSERHDDLPGDARALLDDLGEIRRETTYEYHTMENFFERLAETTPRPLATEALRGTISEPVSAGVTERFSGVSPTDSEGLIRGLKRGFREYGHYDAPRYVAGSVQDNVIMGAADLRAPFEGPTDIGTLLEEGRTGLFCYELTYRAIEAIHSVSAIEQRPPLAAFWVRDRRHKHVYNGLASVIRDEGECSVPVTFVDYTDSTLYDDLRITRLTGEGLCAYDRGHRADEIYWSL